MGSWGLNSIPALGPTLKDYLSFETTSLGILMSSFYIGTATMALLYSFYFDQFKIKTVLALGLFLIGFFVILIGIFIETLGIPLLVLFVILSGAGYGLINPAINKAIVLWFPQKVRSTIMSFKQMGVMFGSMFSAAILPSLAQTTSISFSFVLSGMLIITLALLIYLLYNSDTKEVQDNLPDSTSRKAAVKKLINDRNLLLCNITAMLLVGAQFSFIMYVALYFQTVFNIDIVRAGLVLSLASFGGVVGRLAWGIISDYFNKRKLVLVVIGVISLVFCFVLALLPLNSSFITIAITVTIYGFCIGGWNGVLQALVVELADSKLSGLISGYNLSAVYFSTFLIPLMFGIFVETFQNYRFSWFLSGASIFIATVLIFKVKEGRIEDEGSE